MKEQAGIPPGESSDGIIRGIIGSVMVSDPNDLTCQSDDPLVTSGLFTPDHHPDCDGGCRPEANRLRLSYANVNEDGETYNVTSSFNEAKRQLIEFPNDTIVVSIKR